MERHFADLVARIERASTVREVIGHVMDRLPVLVRGEVTAILFFDEHSVCRHLEFTGRDDRLAQRYVDYGVPHDDVLKAMMISGLPVHDMMLREERAWRQHPMFLEFGRRENLRHYGGSPLLIGGVARGCIACARPDGDEPLNAQDLLDLTTIAVRVQDRLARLESHRPRTAFDLLSRRQLEICEQVSHGRSNAEIAQKLGITVDGVKAHLKQIFSKVCVESRDQLTTEFLFWFPSGSAGFAPCHRERTGSMLDNMTMAEVNRRSGGEGERRFDERRRTRTREDGGEGRVTFRFMPGR